MKLFIFLCFILAATSADLLDLINPITSQLFESCEIAKPEQIPYQAALIFRDPKRICSGILISEYMILTAAHCTYNVPDAEVYLGFSNNLNTLTADQRKYFVTKENIITHEKYDSSTHCNDIALIKLPEPVTFSRSIIPANLPRIHAETSCVLWKSFWTTNSDGSHQLYYYKVPRLTKLVCEILDIFTCNNICINIFDLGKYCTGDSAESLVCRDGDMDYIVAFKSYDIGIVGVYTSVSSNLNWINEKSGVIGL